MRLMIVVIIIFTGGLANAQEKFTGHIWEKYGKEEVSRDLMKAFLSGWIHGHRFGYSSGQIVGGGAVLAAVESLVPSEQRKAIATEAVDSSLHALTQGLELKVDHYFNEVTAFYATFPLCKGQEINWILTSLVQNWTKAQGHQSYQDIGADCGK